MRVRSNPPLNFSGPEPVVLKPRRGAAQVDERAAEPQLAEAAPEASAEPARTPEPEAETATAPVEPIPPAVDLVTAEEPRELEPLKLNAVEPIDEPASEQPRTRAPRSEVAHGMSRYAYLIAVIASALWVGGAGSWAAYQYGLGEIAATPLNLAMLALVAVAPVGLIFTAAAMARQSARLAAEAQRARSLSEAMVAPAALASEQTAEAVRAMRAEIDHAVAAAERARTELSALREALGQETRQLNEAADEAGRTAKALALSLGEEREQMSKLGESLDRQAAGVIDAVERQARMVADASDLAQTQLREAEAALAARAADLAAAAGEAQDAARLAADDLARQTIRLETAGSGVAEQIRSVEDGLSQQRAALVTTAFSLRSEQEDFSAQVETQRAQLVEALTHTRLAAGDLGDASAKSAEILRDLVHAAADQFQALSDLAGQSREEFAVQAREAAERFRALSAEIRDDLVEETNRGLNALTEAAEDTRRRAAAAADEARRFAAEAAEESRRSAAEAAEDAKLRVDRLAEAAFEAKKRADETFDAATEQARRLIEQSSALVDDAGERSAARLESNLAQIKGALGEVDLALSEIDGRAARLPDEARARVEEIRGAVEQGLEALAVAARKAAEETQAVDAAFQDRVKRNYDMLSEAVKLMNMVSGAPTSSAPASRRREEPPLDLTDLAPPRMEVPHRREPRSAPEESSANARAIRTLGDAQRQAREARELPRDAEMEPSASAGLRPRLKLKPTDGDENIRDVFEPVQAQPKSIGDSWTWRDLLGGMDGRAEPPEPTLDDETLADRLIDEIGALGVDPNALLPRTRVEEAAAAYQHGDPDGAREVVLRVAPAAVRRIRRRIMTEKSLRAQAERFVDRYEGMLADAARQDQSGYMSISLLASESGRAFLLIDAAVGEPA
ncbi:MAG: tipN [Proteobacteria bacterium]|nr:tipN [Pseudomonadota bacterium]